MTKEEAIKILTGYMGGKIDPESTELYHAIELAVDTLESQPSLPSDLDEAAEEYEDWVESYSQSDFPTCVSFRQAFKAGADWLAGRGVTVDGIITKVGYKLDVETTEYLLPEESEFERGDKVIVQIRKKQ